MTEILTAAQMREIEQWEIREGTVSGLDLMEQAAEGVLKAMFAHWPQMAHAPHNAVVLCGPGNNGGDGFVVARLLRARGWEVAVYLYGDAQALPPDAHSNLLRWYATGGQVLPFPEGDGGENGGDTNYIDKDLQAALERSDIIIDALFGIGLTRPLPPSLAALAGGIRNGVYCGRSFEDSTTPVVAVDIPSGINADTGYVAGERAFSARLTVTFLRPKFGHYLAEGPAHCGKLVLAPLAVPDELVEIYFDITALYPFCYLWDRPTPLEKTQGHKYDHGSVLVLGGPSGAGGAARLAARGALRIGAGLVTLACPPEALAENAAQLNAVMLRPCADAQALAQLLQDMRVDVLCLGPGLPPDDTTRALVATALDSGKRVVLDAGALTAFAGRFDALCDMLHENVLLTPHMGEFARLMPPEEQDRRPGKISQALAMAGRSGAVVLLKGPDTVVARAPVRGLPVVCVVSAHYDRAVPWLATAGAGDVLAGFAAGLMARNSEPLQAGCNAAWLQVECARRFGPGLIAEDLPEQLPAVLRQLERDGGGTE